MKIKFIKPSFEFEMVGDPTQDDILGHIERAGRTCYKSEANITADSSREFVRKIIKMGHESVLEHFSFSIRFICDRGVTHEMVRHRLSSFSQESTRYVGYGDAVEFIIPPWVRCNKPFSFSFSDESDPCEDCYMDKCTYELNEEDCPIAMQNEDMGFQEIPKSLRDADVEWVDACVSSAGSYNDLLKRGWKPQQARSVLPNSLKTEIVVTANLRQWRTMFKQRAESSAAHPQIREIMIPALEEAKVRIPVVFDDIMEKT